MTTAQKAVMYDLLVKAIDSIATAHAMRSTVPLSENRLFRDQVYSVVENWCNQQPMETRFYGKGIGELLGLPKP